MRKLLAPVAGIALCVGASLAVAWQVREPAENARANAAAGNDDPIFRSMFDPMHAPSQKAMGLLQSSFLDALDRSGPKLQIAWVIDATTSMQSAWSGLKASIPAMVEDLRRRFGEQVSFAIVVYRDAGASDGKKVTLVVPDFETDPLRVQAAFQQVELGSGAPYFPEPVDLAVRQALDLPWSTDPDTTRWMIVMGDAPPFGPPFEDAKIGAVREVSDDLLIDQARLKGVNIHTVLCRSDAADYPVFQQVVDRTRAFMTALSNGTGGVFLDTSLDQVRQELSSRSQALRAETRTINPISPDDVARAQVDVPRRLRIAVLPHGVLKPVDWNMSDPESRIAMELQQKLTQVPGVDVVSSHAVERSVRVLARREQGQELSQQLANKALSAALQADYIIWGRVDEKSQALKSGLFDGRTGQLLAQGEAPLEGASRPADGAPAGSVMLVSTLMSNGYRPSQDVDDPLLQSFLSAMKDGSAAQVVVSADPQVQQAVLAAYRDLESATAIPLGEAEAAPLLRDAERRLQQALQRDPNHPWAHYLLASCYFNQAQISAAAGNATLMKEQSANVRKSLNRAFAHANRPAVGEPGDSGPKLMSEMMVLQIKADHALLVRGDHQAAAELYRQLIANRGVPESVRRSATWMLLGLHLGDWSSPLNDPAEARTLAIELLARWPDSPEAEFLKRVMRWRQDRGSLIAEIPLVNQMVMSQ